VREAGDFIAAWMTRIVNSSSGGANASRSHVDDALDVGRAVGAVMGLPLIVVAAQGSPF